MKKNIFSAAVIAAMVAASLTACDKSKQEAEVVAPAEALAGEMKTAYVEYDSILTQYQFCKDADQILTKKGQSIEATLQQKQQELQGAAANFQQKLQQNAYTQEEAQRVQAGLQKQAQDLDALRQRLTNGYAEEQAKYQKAVQDSLHNFIARFNSDKKYAFIFSKSGDNLLYADKSLDITAQIIAGLNKAYKPSDLKKAETKEEKK